MKLLLFLLPVLVFAQSTLLRIPHREIAKISSRELSSLDIVASDKYYVYLVDDSRAKSVLAAIPDRSKSFKSISAESTIPRTSFEQYLATIDGLSKSAILHSETIGYSFENRPIIAVRLPGDKRKKPVFAIISLQHSREWSAFDATFSALLELSDNLNNEPLNTSLSDIEIWFVPLVNPDGYVYSYEHDRLWRKNRGRNRSGSIGSDLNRNYPFHFNEEDNTDSSSMTYPGDKASSEPETKTIVAFLKRIAPFGVLDIHCYAQAIFYPWAYTEENADAVDLLSSAALRFTDLLAGLPDGTNYLYGQPTQILSYLGSGVGGSLMDYAYNRHTSFSFALELPPRSDSFTGFSMDDRELAKATRDLKTLIDDMAAFLIEKQRKEGSDLVENKTNDQDSGTIDRTADSEKTETAAGCGSIIRGSEERVHHVQDLLRYWESAR